MKNEILICDRCGEKNDSTTERFKVCIEKYTDAAGSSDTRTQDFDLCSGCKSILIKQIINNHLNYMPGVEGFINSFMGKTVPKF